MGKVQAPPNIKAISDPKEFATASAQIHKDTVEQINGRLQFDENLATQTLSVKFPTANADVAISHNLMKTGVKYIKASQSVPCNVYDGSKASNKNTIYLRCDQPATVTLILA